MVALSCERAPMGGVPYKSAKEGGAQTPQVHFITFTLRWIGLHDYI